FLAIHSNLAMRMSQIFDDLLLFIKNPQVNVAVARLSPKNFLGLLLMTLALVIPYAWVLYWVGVGQFDNVMEDFMRDHKYLVLVLAVSMTPLLELTIFSFCLSLQ